MSEYTLYIVTALLVTLTIATSHLAFGPEDAIPDSGIHLEQASYGGTYADANYRKLGGATSLE